MVWNELIIRGITNALVGLSQMVGTDVGVESINMKTIPAKDMPDMLGGPERLVVGIYLRFSGAASGHIMIAQRPEVACTLLDMIMGNAPGTTASLDEIESSALAEMGNITGTFFLNAVADAVGKTLYPSPPLVVTDMAGAILDVALAEILHQYDDVFVAETTFGIQQHMTKGTFLVMPNPSLIEMPLATFGR
jgi:chemotaxis protein CheC